MSIREIAGISTLLMIGLLTADMGAAASVLREEGRIYIRDQRGERWDITQAESLGFDPERFQYGIGRDAFIPLDDTRVRTGSAGAPDSLRVIGVVEGDKARAYSVPTLTGHEVANSTLGGREIAVAY